MRAWNVLHALATEFDVHLLVGSRYFPCRLEQLERAQLPVVSRGLIPVDPLRDWLLLHHRLRQWMGLVRGTADWLCMTRTTEAAVCRFLMDKSISVIHVFRLYMWPVAELAINAFPGACRQLDMDDIESLTRSRLAWLYGLSGKERKAAQADREALFMGEQEERILPQCDLVWVCSPLDGMKLAAKKPKTFVGVVPNTVAPPTVCPPLPRDGPFCFLFIGTMGYFPNRDAVRFLCNEIVPQIRKLGNRPFRVKVVGKVPVLKPFRGLLPCPEVEFVGAVEDIAGCYAGAHAVLVPLRAGGGTRIKVIEAFAYRRPVVATALALEGLEVRDGTHALVAETPYTLARQCVNLMNDGQMADSLATAASRLFENRYHPDVVADAVRTHTIACAAKLGSNGGGL
jgi:glycosyltransferase involved in cell wall biosynthesis